MQLLMGISTKRYAPAIVTAGLARDFVNGYSRDPAPPPKMTANRRTVCLGMKFLMDLLQCWQ